MKVKASFAALVSLLVLTGASRQPEPWSPGFWCSEDGPRQLPVVVMVTPVKAVFEAGEPLLVRVTITNNLRTEIGFLTCATEMKDWNGEVWNLSMVEIGRPGGLTIPGSYRPVVTPPIVIAGVSRKRVAPGQTLTITTNLRKWDIGGWDPANTPFASPSAASASASASMTTRRRRSGPRAPGSPSNANVPVGEGNGANGSLRDRLSPVALERCLP